MPAISPKAFLQSFSMVSRSGQAGVVSSTVKLHIAVSHGQVLHHAEADNVAMELRILNFTQCVENLFFSQIFHNNPFIKNYRLIRSTMSTARLRINN